MWCGAAFYLCHKPMRTMENGFTQDDARFMARAIELSEQSVASGGGPFGAVIVLGGQIIAEGVNVVTRVNDPTAHAEVSAIRQACSRTGSFKLDGCTIYTSCEPCPMCLSAIYWAGIQRIFYGNSKEDAAAINFDDSFIYDEISKPRGQRAVPCTRIMEREAARAFALWEAKPDKVEY